MDKKLFIKERIKNLQYQKRLNYEMQIIHQKKFVDVFMNALKLVQLIKHLKLPYYVRGSSVCSLVCYVMGISQLDPIKYNLPFCRFINIFRDDCPDIDIDIPSEYRDTIFAGAQKLWNDKVARFSVIIHHELKSAIREYVRSDLQIRTIKEQTAKCEELYLGHSKAELEKLVSKYLHQVKCYGQHGSGLVIRPEPIPEDLIFKEATELQPQQIKLDKEQINQLKWPKIDILSNSGLSQLLDIRTKLSIKTTYNDDDNNDDDDTWELIQSGDLFGLTFGESRLMVQMVKIVQPVNLEELAVCLSLIRPSVASLGQREEIIKSISQNKATFDRTTFLIFDDDIIQYIKNVLDQCLSDSDSESDTNNYAEAEYYRKAFYKQNKKQISEFVTKLVKAKQDVKSICGILLKHCVHSFCLAHALSIAKLIYQLAYHKVHNPEAFWPATIKHYHGEYRNWVIHREAINKLGSSSVIADPKERLIQLATKGYWLGPDFVPNCYVHVDNNKINFKGPIACHRVINYGDKYCKVYLTIGYDNGLYLDLVVNGDYALEFKLKKKLYIVGLAYIKGDENLIQNYQLL